MHPKELIMNQETTAGLPKKTSSGKRLSGIIMDDYLQLHQRAGEGAFVVWIAIVVPAELFAGFDNVVYAVPESHAAMSAGKGVGALQCEKAEQEGYSSGPVLIRPDRPGNGLQRGQGFPLFRPAQAAPAGEQ